MEKGYSTMKKLRVVMVTNSLKRDGISSVIMNYCTHLNPDKFEITIISGASVVETNKIKCIDHGIQLIELPERKTASRAFYRALNRTLAEGNYDICHVHGNSATSLAELLIAQMNHIKVRIMHCHNSQCQHKIIHLLLSPIFKRMYTGAFACSRLAGNWIFGANKFTVIPNAFEIEQYSFDMTKRQQYRKDLNLGNNFVIGYVGRINYQKNCWYVLKCFEKYLAENPKARLLLVGDGPEREELEKYVEHSSYRNSVTVYGESEDVPGLLSAMDIFLFPSRYEGLGISAVEAQISGIPCIISDVVPEEVQIAGQSIFLPIGDGNISLWIDKIREFSQLSANRNAFFRDNRNVILKYDIKAASRTLEDLYYKYFLESRKGKGRKNR